MPSSPDAAPDEEAEAAPVSPPNPNPDPNPNPNPNPYSIPNQGAFLCSRIPTPPPLPYPTDLITEA